MKIINKSKGTILAERAFQARSLLQRVIGLLNRKGLEEGEALIIHPCNSIHTFFMRFAIDVLFVDKESRVIKAIPSLEPFRLTRIYFKAKFVIELPTGAISSTSTCPGDLIGTPFAPIGGHPLL